MRFTDLSRERVLVLGGTLYIGALLVPQLLREGAQVTILSRGSRRDGFGTRVQRLRADRQRRDSFLSAVEGRSWDIVYDNLCFTEDDAQSAIQAFSGRVKKYVMTSSQAVYGKSGCLSESAFEPETYFWSEEDQRAAYTKPIYTGSQIPATHSYGECKRRAESIIARGMLSPFNLVRFPMVLGPNDPMGRFLGELKRGLSGEVIRLHPGRHEVAAISVGEAARFLAWLRHSPVRSAVNAASHGGLESWSLFETMGQMYQRPIKMVLAHENTSCLSYPQTVLEDCTKAESAGFKFDHVEQWLSDLMRMELAHASLSDQP